MPLYNYSSLLSFYKAEGIKEGNCRLDEERKEAYMFRCFFDQIALTSKKQEGLNGKNSDMQKDLWLVHIARPYVCLFLYY
jgi:hypothetical protein